MAFVALRFPVPLLHGQDEAEAELDILFILGCAVDSTLNLLNSIILSLWHDGQVIPVNPSAMWSSILLWGGWPLFLYLSRSRLNQIDVGIAISIPWYCLASVVLLVRYYQELLSRVSYILLLIYWFGWVSGGGLAQHFKYTSILIELMRSRHAEGGETNDLGVHWTINIAEFTATTTLTELLYYLFPHRTWSLAAFNAVLGLVVFGNSVAQMFFQKQITRIARLNRATYKWRDYGLECFWHNVSCYLGNRVTRSLIYIWLWLCYQAYQKLTPDLMSQTIIKLCTANLCYAIFFGARSPWISRMIGWIAFYRVWLRELARFSNPNPPIYKYSKLEKADHIRLVLLHPRFGIRPVSCSMLQGPHMRLLHYEAISYTWGSPDRTQEILIDGCKMKVTESVYEILATFSSQFLPQLLWIDAICIDQDNDEEKDQQVPMMDKIYSSGLFTTVFLSQSSLPEAQNKVRGEMLPYKFDGIRPRDEQTRLHFETARLAFDLFNEFHVLEKPIEHQGKDAYEMYETITFTSSKSLVWSSLLTFLQHPWFSRVWVVQEVALSHTVKVRYGDEVIDWKTIANALKMIHDLRQFRLWLEWSHGVQIRHTEHSSLYNIIRMDKLRESLWPTENGYRKHISITDVLVESFYFKATDPRDQVYGLASLCTDKDSMQVSYHMPVDRVYLAAATELALNQSFGVIFGAAGIGNRVESGPISSKLPSWVPNWTDAPKYDRIRHPDEDDFAYRVGLNSVKGEVQELQPAITLVGDSTLLISATLVDTIIEVGPALFDTTYSDRGEGVIDEMCRLCTNYDSCRDFLASSNRISDPYVHSSPHQTLLEAFHHSLTTGHSKLDLTLWASLLGQFRNSPDTNSTADRNEIYDTLQSMDTVTEKLESYCGRRRLYVSEKGWMGLCPPGARKGDKICSIRGVKIPIMLRMASGGSDARYKLVGECYCQGLKTDESRRSSSVDRTIEVV